MRERRDTHFQAIMKMLFFSADRSEVQLASAQFSQAGIPCEIRGGTTIKGEESSSCAGAAELWIHNDRDCHRALMLCVRLGIGFGRRPSLAPYTDTDARAETAESVVAEME